MVLIKTDNNKHRHARQGRWRRMIIRIILLFALLSLTSTFVMVMTDQNSTRLEIEGLAQVKVQPTKVQPTTSEIETTKTEEDQESMKSPPKVSPKVSPKSSDMDCCALFRFKNPAHTLTETVYDLHRCGPVVFFNPIRQRRKAFHSHLDQIADILGKKTTMKKAQCVHFYEKRPSYRQIHDAHGAFSPIAMKAANRTAKEHASYDAFEISKALRKVQKKVLSHCNIETPKFKLDSTYDTREDDDLYEQLTERPPSRSVTIIRRKERAILNSLEILEMCQGLDLDCRHIESDAFFKSPNATDICYSLKPFERSLVIAAQGADLINAHYTFSRLLLLPTYNETITKEFDVESQSFAIRYDNNKTLDGNETRLATGFVSRKNEAHVVVNFFLEFALHFGNKLMVTKSTLKEGSWGPERGCSNKNLMYCADQYVDIEVLREKLITLIENGELLTKKDLSTKY